MMILVQMIQLLTAFAEIGFAFAFCFWITDSKPDKRWKWVVLGIVGSAIVLVHYRSIQTIFVSNIDILLDTVYVWLIMIIVVRKNIVQYLGAALSCLACCGLINMFYGNIALFVLGDDVYFKQIYYGVGSIRRCVIYLGTLGTIFVISFFLRKVQYLFQSWRWMLLTFGIVEWWATTWAQGQIFFIGWSGSLWTSSILLILIILTFLGMVLSINFMKIRSENKIIQLKNQMWNDNFKEMRSVYENTIYTYHDMKNHVLVLKKYADEGNLEGIQRYLNGITKPLEQIKRYVWCRNESINLIINIKMLEAQKYNIDIQVDIGNMEYDVEESDLCCILTNLLDNAIDACKKIEEGKRWIWLRMKDTMSNIVIRIENSITVLPRKRADTYISSKEQGHGYGMKSVQQAVGKYGGIMSCENTAEQFTVTITFFK